ncbi:hypothetical protein [Arenimonas sp.]|uniref:hypothetical protein n=1 Tax=Arenimonas sp. TaxID=1872635 RepID=UPI0039E48F5A
MKPSHLLLLALVFPAVGHAELTDYQKTVVETFAAAGTDANLRAAYEAVAAGKATPAQRNVIRTSEMIHEDLKLNACVRPAMGADMSLDAAMYEVVVAGRGKELLADAKGLFTDAEWKAGVPAGAAFTEQVVAAAVLMASGARPTGQNAEADMRALKRRVTLNYYLSFATRGKCAASPQLKKLLGKEGK